MIRYLSHIKLSAAAVLFLCGSAFGQDFAAHPCRQIDVRTDAAAKLDACEALLLNGDFEPDQRGLVLESLGIAQRETGALEQSIVSLEAALALLDSPTRTLRMLAWTHRYLGNYKRAETIYTDVLKTDAHWQGYLSRCVVRQDLGNFEASLPDCAKVYVEEPDMPDARYFYGKALNILGRNTEALRVIGTPDDDDINGRLYEEAALGLWSLERPEEAKAMMRKGIAAYPMDTFLVETLDRMEAP